MSREQEYWDVLKRIAQYETPEWVRKNAQKLYFISGDEAIDMAYENVVQEAKRAIRGRRRPKGQELASGRCLQ